MNTNMFVEAFCRVLKVIYLHHKQNRRVDIPLITLPKVARDKEFDRFVKREKQKQTHRMWDINRRHKVCSRKTNAIFQQLKQTLNGEYNHNQNQLHTIQFSDTGSHALVMSDVKHAASAHTCLPVHV